MLRKLLFLLLAIHAKAFEPLYINCGSKYPTVDSTGITWEGDEDLYTSGYSFFTWNYLSSSHDALIFQTFRFSMAWSNEPLGYRIPVAAGRTYELTMYFSSGLSSRMRDMDIYVEDILVFEKLEIAATENGPKNTMVFSTNVTVLNDIMDIELDSENYGPYISAIKVTEAKGTATSPTIAVTSAPVASTTAVITNAPTLAAPPTKKTTNAPVVVVTSEPVASPKTLAPVVANGIFTEFQLIDASLNAVIKRIVNGETINLREYGSPNKLNVVAVTENTDVRSVKFIESGRTENVVPYAYCGDISADYYACSDIREGSNTVTAIALSRQRNELGQASIAFELIDQPIPVTTKPPVSVPSPHPSSSPSSMEESSVSTGNPVAVTQAPTQATATARPTTLAPTKVSTGVVTATPTISLMTRLPTSAPTTFPSAAPTAAATAAATSSPTRSATVTPTLRMTDVPTATAESTDVPTVTMAQPSSSPTIIDVTGAPTDSKTVSPTVKATTSPTRSPTDSPTVTITSLPTGAPTIASTKPETTTPTMTATKSPTNNPTETPTNAVTDFPTISPTTPPTKTETAEPTGAATKSPTKQPTESPTKNITDFPTITPTMGPTETETAKPTAEPTKSPTKSPTAAPTKTITDSPTASPTVAPTKRETAQPTKGPTKSPSKNPTVTPTNTITDFPTISPTAAPTKAATDEPTVTATPEPTISPTAALTIARTDSPTVAVNPVGGQWLVTEADADLTNRHEACFVMIGDVAILAGGRFRGGNNVDIYDPTTRTWREGKSPPRELHHMQCVEVDGKLWIVSAWTGNYPTEDNAGDIFIYDPATDSWSTKPGLPEARQRGSTAVVLVESLRRIYVSHGNRGGHETGDHAVTLGWLDYFDIDNDFWVTGLPDAPNPRDHTGGALVNGNKICISGGRDSGETNFFANLVYPTDCYDLNTNTWSVEADIPVGGAGGSYGTTCDGKLMIAGGEVPGRALSDVFVFDGTTWTTMPSLNIARHGSGLAVNCRCNQIYIASGSGSQGGSPELGSVETFFPGGADAQCPASLK